MPQNCLVFRFGRDGASEKCLGVKKPKTCPSSLRTGPTKYKGFCARLGPGGKSRSLQGLLESTKKKGGSHAFSRDN